MYVNFTCLNVLPLITSHRCGCLALQGSRPPADNEDAPRRHSTSERRLVRSGQLFRATFSGVVTAALAVVRLKHRLAKRLKVEVAGGKKGATLTSACVPRPRCCGWSCANASLNGPVVV
jgi:hypothetical protein